MSFGLSVKEVVSVIVCYMAFWQHSATSMTVIVLDDVITISTVLRATSPTP